MQEIRCEKCNKLLCKIREDNAITRIDPTLITVPWTSDEPVQSAKILEIKCVRCGNIEVVPLD